MIEGCAARVAPADEAIFVVEEYAHKGDILSVRVFLNLSGNSPSGTQIGGTFLCKCKKVGSPYRAHFSPSAFSHATITSIIDDSFSLWP